MKAKGLLFFLLFVFPAVLFAQNKYEWKQATSGGYTYKYVANDPVKARFYTLKNGLTVILTENKKEPRISVRIPVRTGSNNDPKNHTGLAHYLEHLLFKGTDKFGSLDWQKEKPLLDKIDALYEQYNSTTDEEKRREIYKEIDKTSGEAAKYAIANEYDKMMSAIGSQGTNAHTWVEETVYHEDIPTNAVDKFLAVQAERFRNPIFRIFHTELEAVYEEKNRSLDNDGWKLIEAGHSLLFPTHNYGQQTTIGTIEHLKNPSLKAIREYYNKYYVPNNIAVIMSGDFNSDALIKKIDAAFSYMKPKPVDEYKGPKEAEITQVVSKDIFGPSAESVRLNYRTPAFDTHDALMVQLISSVLSNGKAGLLDLNLNKQQKLLGASAGVRQYKDYGTFIISASPKQNQSLEQARDLLLQQIDILKKGDFDEALIKAIVANYKLEILQEMEDNTNRANYLMDAFVKSRGKLWNKDVSMLDDLGKISKKDVVAFANKFFKDNYVVLYKRKGEDKDIQKVEKPPITPVETNAGKQSAFVKNITEKPLPAIAPKWIDYKKDIQFSKMKNAEVLYVPNTDNSLFTLQYRYNIGNWNSKVLPVALQYLQYIGTDKNSAEEISKSFYNLAANFTASSTGEETNIVLTGLDENFNKAVSLFEDLIANCKEDDGALESLKERLIKARSNNKLNKQAIAVGLRNYAMYGAVNPYNYTLSDEEIKNLKASDLVALLHSLNQYEHKILYYGPRAVTSLVSTVSAHHPLPAEWLKAPSAAVFNRSQQSENKVLFADYDAVQAEVFWVKNLTPYDPKQEALVNVFNSYFGGGMGSIVFQTIRESKALAYSTYAYVQTPAKKDDMFSFVGYVGSQADKFNDAVAGMNELLTDLPTADQNFINAQKSLVKDLETERVAKMGIILSYLAAQKKGLSEDIRKANYSAYTGLKLDDIVKYHQQQFVKQPYTYCIVASEKRISTADMEKYGKVQKLSLEEIFGY